MHPIDVHNHMPRIDQSVESDYAEARPLTTQTMKALQADPSTSDRVRRIMRSIPQPVVIVLPDTRLNSGTDEAHGILVASFTCVTLEPKPYVSFNIKRRSKTYDEILRARKFLVLASSHAGLASYFARSGNKAKFIYDIIDQKTGLPRPQKGIDWWIRCHLQVQRRLDIGDHSVVVGKVLDASRRLLSANEKSRMSVIYQDRKYRRLVQVADPDVDASTTPSRLSIEDIGSEELRLITPNFRVRRIPGEGVQKDYGPSETLDLEEESTRNDEAIPADKH